MRTRVMMVMAAALTYGACQGKLFTIRIDESDVVTVERGTVLEELLVDFGFGDFVSMDLTEAEEIQNQGVAPGDIVDTRLELFELTAVAPSGGDLSFLDDMALYVEAPGLPRKLVAWQDEFPTGVDHVVFELEDLDLTDYVVSEAMTLSTEVSGRRPSQDTDVEAHFELAVGVTRQGACNNAKRDG